VSDPWTDGIRLSRHLAQLVDKDLNDADLAGGVTYYEARSGKQPYIELAIEHLKRALRTLEPLVKEKL